MEVTFPALVKKIEITSLRSLDKGGRVTLEFSAEDPDLVDKLNRCMAADCEVQVAMVKENT